MSQTTRLNQSNLLLTCVVLIVGIYLQAGHWLGGSRFEERVELGVIPLLLLLLAPLLLLSKSSSVERLLQGSRSQFLACGTLITIFLLVAHRPVAQYPYLWHGFGWLIAGPSVLVAVLVVMRTNLVLKFRHISRLGRSRARTALTTTILLCVYLPTCIQTSRGIINLGDASHQVLEEISGPLVGKFPGVNFISTYTSLLGVPLVVLRPFGLSIEVKMTVVLIWVNLLVLAVPISLVLIARRLYPAAQIPIVAMMITAPILVSGRWGSAASNVESLSMIPGRTLGPVLLGLIVIVRKNRTASLTARQGAILGCTGVLVLLNNFEFGFGALVAAFLLVALESLVDHKPRQLMHFGSGAILGIGLYVAFSLAVAGPYDYRFRFAQYFGKPYSPAEYFPSWSLHNVILALFCTSIVLGVTQLRISTQSLTCGSVDRSAARAAIYFGLWGILAFPYCAYRCVEGMYMSTQIYLIPAVMCSAAIIRYLAVDWSMMTSWSFTEKIRSLPVLFLIGLGSFSVLQAPNPLDEWMRVGDQATSANWAVSSDRPPANEWSTNRIDWIDVDIFTPYRNKTGVGYFGYMGNSVEIATGLKNLTQINSGEILQIKGTDVVKELACKKTGTLGIDQVLVLGIQNQCEFTEGFSMRVMGDLNIFSMNR